MTDGNSENPYGQQPGQGDTPSEQPQSPYGPPPTQPYAQQPWGQGTPPPPYGQPGQPYGQPTYPPYQGYQMYPAARAPEDGGAQTAMIVGIVALGLGLVGCGLGFLGSPVAWILGAQAKRRIDASQGQLGGRGNAQAGFVLGIVGTVLLVLGILALIIFILVVGLSVDWSDDGGTAGTAA